MDKDSVGTWATLADLSPIPVFIASITFLG